MVVKKLPYRIHIDSPSKNYKYHILLAHPDLFRFGTYPTVTYLLGKKFINEKKKRKKMQRTYPYPDLETLLG